MHNWLYNRLGYIKYDTLLSTSKKKKEVLMQKLLILSNYASFSGAYAPLASERFTEKR